MSEKTNGQLAYEAYAGATNWKSLVNKKPLPPWPEVTPEIKQAWETSAAALLDLVPAPVLAAQDIAEAVGLPVTTEWPELLEKVRSLQPTKDVSQWDGKPAGEQIDKLAKFILETFPKEPSASESAIEVAIRLLRTLVASIGQIRAEHPDLAPSAGHDDVAEVLGLLRVARMEKDGWRAESGKAVKFAETEFAAGLNLALDGKPFPEGASQPFQRGHALGVTIPQQQNKRRRPAFLDEPRPQIRRTGSLIEVRMSETGDVREKILGAIVDELEELGLERF